MKVCVLSGSPKGKYSITYQTVRFLEKKYQEDSFSTIFVGQTIKGLERDMTPAIEAIKNADLLLFCYPVYTFMAPYQLHRFIRLLKESNVDVRGKFSAQITTSKHFYDVTAHKYIEENCLDLGLKYLGGLSADMEDLLDKKGQEEAVKFWSLIKYKADNNLYSIPTQETKYEEKPYLPSMQFAEKSADKKIVVVASLKEDDGNLKNMIEDFCAISPYDTKVINLYEFPFKGGCLGCFGCSTSGKCVYTDGFDDFLRTEIQQSDAIVYAFRIEDHSMGDRMKLFDDRQFCNGHRTVTKGMPIGYIICGNLDAERNLNTVIEGRSQVGGNYLCGTATDQEKIKQLVLTLDYAIKNHLTLPSNFLGVGGIKIFRDLIYLMQGMMKADHKFYKKEGMYDFPQKKKGTIFKMKLVGGLFGNKKIRAKMGNMMNEGMIMPYEKILKKL